MRWAWVLLVLAACSSTVDAPTASESIAVPIDDTTGNSSNSEAAPASGADISTSTTVDSPAGATPQGFATTSARVTTADGSTCDLCLWLAAHGDQRSQGLMFVTDLGDADGMAFVYPQPRTGAFWMKDTPMPLSIAFYSPDGAFMRSFDMEPCVAEPCESYVTPTDFLVAVEVPQGELDEFGLVDGSTLELLDEVCGSDRPAG